MRRKRPAPDLQGEEPPKDLLRFVPSQPSPIGPHGRPEPWRVTWEPEEFAAFLRARAAWRDTHDQPLPGLPARERHAMDCIGVPQALIEAETSAPNRPPDWVLRRDRLRADDTAPVPVVWSHHTPIPKE